MKQRFMLLLFLFTTYLVAQGEHPGPKKSEHPATTTAPIAIGPKGDRISAGNLAQAIKSFVDADMALRGYFLVLDSRSDKVLRLALDKVHKERLSHIGNDVYFACADFKDPDGTIYDIDIFLQGNNTESLTLTEISVHKEEGVARYTWEEESGLWSKVY